MAESLIGREIGQYKVAAELGRGQHTTVYRAWQPSLERYVALKVLRRYDEATLAKFQTEARLVAQLVQQGVPNIRQIYEVGQTADGYLFVALQYVEDSLRNVLRRAKARSRRFRPEAAARLLKPVAQALDATHSLGWVHLDIKPQNILITRSGRAVLADFGIAQRRGMVTQACTPAYASPEQAAGDRAVGPWSDIYSLGVVLYEMVAGRPPSPTERFETAGELIAALLEPEPFLSSVIKTPSALLGTTSRRVPRRLLLGLVLLLVAALAVAAVWLLRPGLPAFVPTSAPTAVVVTATPAAPTLAPPTGTPRLPTATVPPTSTMLPTATLAPTTTPGE